MTNRDDIREQFSPLLDGELSPEERAVVEAALSDDAELLRELDSLKRVDDLFRALPAETAPGDFEDAIRRRVHPRMAAAAAAVPPRRAKPRRLWVGGLAAAAVLAVCAGVIAFNVNRYSAPTQMAANYDMAAKEAPKPAAAQMESESLRDRNWSASKSAPMPAGGVAPADAPTGGSAPLDAAARSEEMAALGYAGPSAPSEESKGREDFPIGLERQTATKGAAAGAVAGANRRKMDDSANGILDERDHVARGTTSPDAAPVPSSPPARDMQKIEPESAEKDVVQKQISLGMEAEIAPPPAMSEPVAAAAPEPPVPVGQGSAPAAETEVRRMQSVAQTGVAGERKAGSKDSGAREIGGRTFTLREGVWYEDGYNAEPISNVARQSELLRELMTKHTGLRDLLEFREAVVFKVSDRWYKLVPNPEDPRN